MHRKIIDSTKRLVKTPLNKLLAIGKTKYFCIGRNKTGTTSLEKAFRNLGFPLGDQLKAEILVDKYYFIGQFEPIIEYCKSAQVFQDAPFSYPETYKHLDVAYPESKFILTVRDDAEQWYQSITRFHAKKFGNGKIPSTSDLRIANHKIKGFMYNTVKLHKTPEVDPYNKAIMIDHYNQHNQDIIDYFKDRSKDLLIINIAKESSYRRFAEFIGMESPYDGFPWENKT